MNPARPKRPSDQRFDVKRQEIVAVATRIINERGVKGMTLKDVAQGVGLTTTSIAYYFKRKELLAAAVFEQRILHTEEILNEVLARTDTRERVGRLVAIMLAQHAALIKGEAPAFATLSDMAKLEPALRQPLEKKLRAIFHRMQDIFEPTHGAASVALVNARTHILIGLIFFLPSWLSHYALDDYPRVEARIVDILLFGLASDGRRWRVHVLPDETRAETETGAGEFMRIATRMLNDYGYPGTSVDGIALAAGVTKGSFYHHVRSKDDLVAECMRSNHRRISEVVSASRTLGGQLDRLIAALATLCKLQFENQWPLLRSTVWGTLPLALFGEYGTQFEQLSIRFAGIVSDGVAEGSFRRVDALIAGQMIVSAINSAYDLQAWASQLPLETAIALYVSTVIDGLFDDRVLAEIRATA